MLVSSTFEIGNVTPRARRRAAPVHYIPAAAEAKPILGNFHIGEKSLSCVKSEALPVMAISPEARHRRRAP